MHDASLARPPAVVLTDCWTGLAPLVHFDTRPAAPAAAGRRPLTATTGRLRRLLRLIA